MTSDEIKRYQDAKFNQAGPTFQYSAEWEIAYQLAVLNERNARGDEEGVQRMLKKVGLSDPQPGKRDAEVERGGRPVQIIGPTEDQDPNVWVHFKLSSGGSVHIPVDQIRRMWNAEQMAKWNAPSTECPPPVLPHSTAPEPSTETGTKPE